MQFVFLTDWRSTMADKTVTIDGNPVHLKGTPLGDGDAFPDFSVDRDPGDAVQFDDDEKSGHVHIITSAISVETPVCADQFRRFDQEAADLGDEGIKVWYITRDLPFSLGKFAEEHGLEHVEFLSDYRDRDFGEKTGLAIEETELLSRATFVVDQEGEVVYSEVLDEIAQEPDYAAAIEAARNAKG
jgi:thiol peroxidase